MNLETAHSTVSFTIQLSINQEEAAQLLRDIDNMDDPCLATDQLRGILQKIEGASVSKI